MAWELSEEEENGVYIAVNTILLLVYNVGEGEDWSERHNTWWGTPRQVLGDRAPKDVVLSDPGGVVKVALYDYTESLIGEHREAPK